MRAPAPPPTYAAQPSVWARFLRDRRGTYAVEMALLALPFFGLLCAILEVSWVSFNAEQLQAAVDAAARRIRTGEAQSADYPTPARFVSGLLCTTTQRLIPSTWDCSRLIVDVRPVGTFASADMSNGFYRGSAQYCLGSPATVVVLRVAYPMSAIFPLSLYNPFAGLANDVPGLTGWFHVLLGSAAFKTEPYGSSSSTC